MVSWFHIAVGVTVIGWFIRDQVKLRRELTRLRAASVCRRPHVCAQRHAVYGYECELRESHLGCHRVFVGTPNETRWTDDATRRRMRLFDPMRVR